MPLVSAILGRSDRAMTIAYAFEPAPRHAYAGHPESPGRFDVLKSRLGAFDGVALASRRATREEITRVHARKLFNSVEDASRQGPGIIDSAPTFVTPSSLEDAALAAGAALECTRTVLEGESQSAFSIARPPGHHAEPQRSMGFCIFNNVAIAATDALERGAKRLAIVDFDAHHGNGTQAAFLQDDRVAYFSAHQWGIYPGTGWFEEAPFARRRVVNVPLPAGSGNETYQMMATQIWRPFVKSFAPELILVSAGFDAHWNDPITSLGLSTAGFYALSADLVSLAEEHCGGRIVFVLEGGYDPMNLANGVEAVFSALHGRPVRDPLDAAPGREPDTEGLLQKIRAWHGFSG